MSAVRNNAPVPLESALEGQIAALATLTGVTRADVIQECVRDRLAGGTFRAPFPVKHPGRQPSGADDRRPDERAEVQHAR